MKYIIAFSIFFLFSQNSFSSVNIFMYIPTIRGVSADPAHKDWMDVLAFTDGATNKVVKGQPTNGSFTEFSFTIYNQGAVNLLRKALFMSSYLHGVKLEIQKGEGAHDRLTDNIVMDDVIVTSITGGITGGQRETVNISFCAAKYIYTNYESNPPSTFIWPN